MNGKKATICGCGISPDCDKPWITWGYIIKEDFSDNIACVILNNVLPTFSNRSKDEVTTLTTLQTLKKYLDYHIYYNDSVYFRKLSDAQKSKVVFSTHFKNQTTELLYDPTNRNIVENDTKYDAYTRIQIEILSDFRVYTKEYDRNGFKYVYKGVILNGRDSGCYSAFRRIWVVPSILGIFQ